MEAKIRKKPGFSKHSEVKGKKERKREGGGGRGGGEGDLWLKRVLFEALWGFFLRGETFMWEAKRMYSLFHLSNKYLNSYHIHFIKLFFKEDAYWWRNFLHFLKKQGYLKWLVFLLVLKNLNRWTHKHFKTLLQSPRMLLCLKCRVTEMTAELRKDKETLFSISPNASRNTWFQWRAHQFIITSHLIDILAFMTTIYYATCLCAWSH